MATEYSVQQLPSPLSHLGEGPVWDVDSQSLYYVDINGAAILRYDYAENKTYSAKIDGVDPISPIILVQGKPGQYVLGTGNKIVLVSWDGRSDKGTLVKTLYDLGESEKHVRFNDGKVDPQGRLYAGTMQLESLGDIMQQKEGKLYRFDGKAGGEFHLLKSGISISNGLTWPENTNKFYYIDSVALDIKEFDVLENGDLQNETVLYDLRVGGKNPGYVADGMTHDNDRNLVTKGIIGRFVLFVMGGFCGPNCLKFGHITQLGWEGFEAKSEVNRFQKTPHDEENKTAENTSKKIEQEIAIPAKQVTSASFGGPQMDELFVTTAHTGNQDAPAGALFKVTGLGARGKPMDKMILKD